MERGGVDFDFVLELFVHQVSPLDFVSEGAAAWQEPVTGQSHTPHSWNAYLMAAKPGKDWGPTVLSRACPQSPSNLPVGAQEIAQWLMHVLSIDEDLSLGL